MRALTEGVNQLASHEVLVSWAKFVNQHLKRISIDNNHRINLAIPPEIGESEVIAVTHFSSVVIQVEDMLRSIEAFEQ